MFFGQVKAAVGCGVCEGSAVSLADGNGAQRDTADAESAPK